MEMRQDHSKCLVKAGHTIISETWAEFLSELEILIAQLADHGRAFMILGVPGPEEMFVQFMVSRDGIAHAEAPYTVLKPCCGRRHLLEYERQALLISLGWRTPVESNDPMEAKPLWWREADARWGFPEMIFSEMLVRTLVEVLGATTPQSLTSEFGNASLEGPYARKF